MMKYPEEIQAEALDKVSRREPVDLPEKARAEMEKRRNARPPTEAERWIVYGMGLALDLPRDYEFDDEFGFRFVPKEIDKEEREKL